MIYRDIPQGSDQWHQLRLGKVTASRVSDVVARTKTGWGAGRTNYMAQLIAERLTGEPTDSYINAAMQHGIDTEPQARAAYEFYRDVEVDQITFADHSDIPMSGASPDGLVLNDGMLEIKCPNTSTHIDYLINKKVPKKYVDQMQWQMACLGKYWADFLSFDPRMPENLRLWIVRVERDQKRIDELTEGVIQFLSELDDKITKLQAISEAA